MDGQRHLDAVDPEKGEAVSAQNAAPTLELGLSLTALWVGYYRMREIEQKTPLFYDPVAKAIMGEDDARWAFQRMQETLEDSWLMSKAAYARSEANFFPVRTRFIDDHIGRSLEAQILCAQSTSGGKPPRQLQVVDMACGFDGRAFRLDFPTNTLFFEVDREEVMALKKSRLSQIRPPDLTCARRVCISADIITDKWETALFDNGFDPALPTVWIMEGILTYLPLPVAKALLARVHAISAPGSSLVCDVVNAAIKYATPMKKRMRFLRDEGAEYNLFISDPIAFWTNAGFSQIRYHFPGDNDASYGRIPPHPFLQVMRIVIRFVIAVLYLGAGFLSGFFLPIWAGIIVLVGSIVLCEGWALLFQEWLARRLTLFFFPLAYFTEVFV